MANWTNRIIGEGDIAVSEVLFNPDNWRLHTREQQDALETVLDEVGWVQRVVVNKTTGHLVDGHLRVLLADRQDEETVPALFVELTEEEEKLVIATLDPIGAMAKTDNPKLRELLDSLASDSEAVNQLLAQVAVTTGVFEDAVIDKPVGQPKRRELPLDVIFTINGAGQGFCCLACNSGLGYGIQSGSRGRSDLVCTYASVKDRHKVVMVSHPSEENSIVVTPSDEWWCDHSVVFIDNDYFQYDHEWHLEVVKKWRPKYATVRDVMTREQCVAAGIAYYPLEQILEWAEELEQYADDVIVIPKFECIDEIPEQYILGYSVPSSHGQTPLPLSAFVGRRTHLLGGSWKAQLSHLAVLGEDVVSLDNNYLMKAAMYGSYCRPDGEMGSLGDTLGYMLGNPLYSALSLSFGAVARKLREMYAPEEEGEEATE